MTAKLAPTVVLRRGARMPHIGFGTFPMDNAQTERAVVSAIGAGYRKIDTAEVYGNEIGVGRGIKGSGIPRDHLFLTSKFTKESHGTDLKQALAGSLDRMGLSYLDLYLIHWPHPGQDEYVKAFASLLKLFDQGLVRAVGTSNFKPGHLQRIRDETGQFPDVNQIQLNPETARIGHRTYHARNGIITESWTPLGGVSSRVLLHADVARIAADKGRTPAQILLRWHIELGLVPIPKSSDTRRMTQNLDVFDFSLSTQDMDHLAGLDLGEGAAVDSDDPAVGA